MDPAGNTQRPNPNIIFCICFVNHIYLKNPNSLYGLGQVFGKIARQEFDEILQIHPNRIILQPKILKFQPLKPPLQHFAIK